MKKQHCELCNYETEEGLAVSGCNLCGCHIKNKTMNTPEHTKDYGTELLKTLTIQRQAFIRSATGERIITNHILYRQMEEELYRIQILIGEYNKKIIKQECDEKAVPYPNFKKESI